MFRMILVQKLLMFVRPTVVYLLGLYRRFLLTGTF